MPFELTSKECLQIIILGLFHLNKQFMIACFKLLFLYFSIDYICLQPINLLIQLMLSGQIVLVATRHR